MGASVNVTTVDVDLSPDIAEKFNISRLPTVVMGNQRVLEGYMVEDDIRDRMFNFIMQNILKKDVSYEKRKENLIWLTRNLIESISRKELIRPNIGDYVHLQALQISTMSLLALDPLASHLQYESGRMNGLYGPYQMMLSNINPEIMQQFRVGPRFHEIIKAIEKFFSNIDDYPVYVTEGAEILELTDTTASIRLYGSAYSVGAPSIGEPLCWYIAGEIAGQIQALLGRFVKVSETSCWGLGNKYCDFFIEVLNEEVSAIITSDSGKEEVQKRRSIFLTTLMIMTENQQRSLLLKKRIRPKIGDFIHVSVVQQALTALKLMDPYCGMLMYSAGSTYGLTGPGKHILQQAIADQGLETPMSLEMAVQLVNGELQHPTSMLARQHSFVDFKILSAESAEIIIQECSSSAGATDIQETFCDFTAGFINGRLRLLCNEEIIVKEIKCHGSGHETCTYQITLE
jgi:predicted hydrocarbon binding protein